MNVATSRSNLISNTVDENGEVITTGTQQAGKQSYRFEQFSKRECKTFIATKSDSDRCCCGRVKAEHGYEALMAFTNREEVWSVPTHTTLQPTDAFGELEFQGAGQCSRAKYIRLSQDTQPELALDLLRNGWNLCLPKLLISVTGGAKNFVLHSKLKQVLRQGLLKAAKTTGAWIITGGTNTGVMRHVGEAVRGHTVMSHGAQLKDNAQQIHLIGIATWGIVDHREGLIGNKDGASYHITSSMTSRGACLDNNHTHFILVDDGTVNKYGGEITFRANLENCISRQEIARSCGDGGHGVPVVLLVLEGGPNTIRTVLESVTRNPAVPVVVANGSGRAADVLAFAYHYVYETEGEMKEMADVVQHRNLLSKIEKAFPEQDRQSCLQIYESVLKCVRRKKYITIFCVDEGGVDIDRAILKALLNGQNSTASHQLSLALVWNRADIARSEIFTDKQKWKKEFLENAMLKALVSDRVEFVELLLENGVSMKHFLTKYRLKQLFQETIKNSVTLQHFFGDCAKVDADCLAERIARVSGMHVSMSSEGTHSVEKSVRGMFAGVFTDHEDGYYSDAFEYPFNKLLVWAVLSNMHHMALFMWQRGDENLAKALVAGKLYKDMSREIAKDERKADVAEILARNSREFLGIALGLLDECYRANEEIAQQLLTYSLENWGGQNCLSLAVATQHEEFVAHTCCQNLLSEIWLGNMRLGKWCSSKVLLGLFCPFSIFVLEFKSNADTSKCTKLKSKEGKTEVDLLQQFPPSAVNSTTGETNIQLRTFSTLNHLESVDGMAEQTKYPNEASAVSWTCKLVNFHSAPITKFWSNVVIYFLFLLVFSYVILVRFPPTPSVPEIVLIIFVFTLFTEEMRQILDSEPTSLGKKFQEWASSYWNICDGCAILLFFTAVGMRLFPETARIGHVLYCLDIMFWIIRLLHIFSVSKVLGPCVVMIGRMTIDLAYFLLVMVVFLMAYGVAQQGILFPQHEASWEIITKVFFRPYFQIYGELFIEDAEENETVFGTPANDLYSGRLVTVIMAFYLLVANILLLNLLIAIFNNTFSLVQANSNQIWKFQRYQLIMEYEHRPVLVPPFIILNHLHILYRACYRKFCCCTCRENGRREIADDKLKPRLSKEDLHKLMLFEEHCSESFLSRKNTLFNASSEERVRVIGERVEAISYQLQETTKEQLGKEEATTKRLRTIENYLSRVEEYTLQILDIVGNMPPSSDADEGAEDISPSGGGVGLSRLMSVPAYMHLQQRQDVKGVDMPLYFRRKYPSQQRRQSLQVGLAGQAGQTGQAGHSSPDNRRQESLTKAVSRFKRSNTISSVHEKAAATGRDDSTPQLLEGPVERDDAGKHVMRATSEAPTFSKPETASEGREVRKRSCTFPTSSKIAKPDAFSQARSLGLHVRSRQSPYPMSDVQRYPVPDFLVDWEMPFPGYDPPVYTRSDVQAKPAWVDVDILDPNFCDVKFNFNAQTKFVNRRSHMGAYGVVEGMPRNPMGRTGIAARGLLGCWGPNHAADAVVTRWKRNETGEVVERLGQRVLEFVAVKRGENLEWSFPGGVMDTGEAAIEVQRREVCELALSSEESTAVGDQFRDFFTDGTEVYKGYVDDPRNTDNAWIETVATNFHDSSGSALTRFQLKTGDDACSAQWREVSGDLKLYANHEFILKRVARLHGAFFDVTS